MYMFFFYGIISVTLDVSSNALDLPGLPQDAMSVLARIAHHCHMALHWGSQLAKARKTIKNKNRFKICQNYGTAAQGSFVYWLFNVWQSVVFAIFR